MALEELEREPELYVFKTHARANELFGTNFRAILIVRDGRDALASYAHYLVDLRFGRNLLRRKLHRMRGSRSELLSLEAWLHLSKMLAMGVLKRSGFRRRLISWRIDQLLNREHRLFFDWSEVNRSWLERRPQPVVVRYQDLVRDPISTVRGAMGQLGLGLISAQNVALPSFAELQQRYASFFRKGTSGDWKNHFSVAQHELFKIEHEPMMKRLNFAI